MKKNKEEKLETRGSENLEAVERIDEGDPETVLREAGAIGKNMVQKLMHAGEEALDELNLERNQQ